MFSVRLLSRKLSVLSIIALLAIISRGMIADGYMLTTDTDDGSLFQIVVCDGTAPTPAKTSAEQHMGMQGHGHHGDHSAHGDHFTQDTDIDGIDHSGHEDMGPTCAFAMSAHTLPELSTDAVSTEVRFERFSRRIEIPVQPGRGLPAPPPPARAPPPFL